tara:strand:+ start:38445 stop:39527 length:1083 start_codon:yes stop_codon:yes gene_type:complete
MIKFFRKIRQNLLMDLPAGKAGNKTSKYFKYAIGEIVLVVIGILIALQINNWNETRNQKQTVKALFLDVQRDLLNDIEEATYIMNWFEELDTIAQNIYNDKYKKEDYLNAKDNTIYKSGITSYPLHLSKQSFETLNTKKELIPEEYKGLLKNLNTIYNEQAHFLELRQNESIQQMNDYLKYLYANYDWMIDYKNNNYTDELIDYHLNNKYHKRQVLLWNQYTNNAYGSVSSIKNDAIVNAIIIHNLFTPEKELPEILSRLSYVFKINKKEDYLGIYDSETEERDYQVYAEHNLLFWKGTNIREIYGAGMPLIELGKDSLGFAASKNYTMVFKRDTKGNVISIDGLVLGKKIIEFKKITND